MSNRDHFVSISGRSINADSSLKTENAWLTTEQAAAYLGISSGTLRNMTSNGQVPYYKLGPRRNRYRMCELNELLLSQKRGGFHGNKGRP